MFSIIGLNFVKNKEMLKFFIQFLHNNDCMLLITVLCLSYIYHQIDYKFKSN